MIHLLFLALTACAQYQEIPVQQQPVAVPNSATMNQNPVNNPAPGNPATNAPTSATLSFPADTAAPKPDRLVDEIRQKIQDRDATLFKAVTVTHRKNILVLQGEVPTAKDKALVEKAARDSAHGMKIKDELHVHE